MTEKCGETIVEGITVTQVQELITTTVVFQVVSDATFWSEDVGEGVDEKTA